MSKWLQRGCLEFSEQLDVILFNGKDGKMEMEKMPNIRFHDYEVLFVGKYFFGNSRELLQCFSFRRLSRTIFGRMKCAIFGRLKYVILGKLQYFSFREIEMSFSGDWNVQFSGDWNVSISGEWNILFRWY